MPHRYRWTLNLTSPPEALWPLVADTDRFNRETGVPRVERDGPAVSLGQPMRLRLLGFTSRWVEQPFEWVEPRRFSIRRDYTQGPIRWLEARLTLDPTTTGTRLTYEIDAEPVGLIGSAVISLQIGQIAARSFVRAFQRYDGLASAAAPASDATLRRDLIAAPAPTSPDHLAWAERRLVQAGRAPALVARLLRHVADAEDHDTARLRPYALADRWRAPRRDTLELMLHATRAGVLELRWDLMCPYCRGSKHAASSLRDLPRGVHCDACHIDFESRFDRLVELTFRPSPAVRTVVDREYCIGGPMVTPHVVMQQSLRPGESREISLALSPGEHRVRTRSGISPEPDRPGPLVDVSEAGAASAALTGPAWREQSLILHPHASLTLTNSAPEPRVFVLERLAWTDDAVTAAQVTTMQTFRDLFSSEALRPGEQASVGSIALLFTDLKDSTRMYGQIGDAPAFGRVMSHFDVLREAVAAEGGAVVKTMGDAVMATFTTAGPAVRAALAAQRRLAQQPANGGPPLRIKAAVHFGPCIAVTQNDRLDYFGSTVNIAARLVTAAEGGEVVVSDEALEEPSLAALAAGGTVVAAEPRMCSFKGLDAPRAAHPVSLAQAPAASPIRATAHTLTQ